MQAWALDLGTTNTGVARWNEATDEPELVVLPAVARLPDGDDPLGAPRMVPTAVQLIEEPGLVDRLGRWGPLARHFFLGRCALIGRPALEHNRDAARPGFVPSFKPALALESLRPLARVGRRQITARVAAAAFLRELLAEVKRTTGARVRDLVVASPVSAFETYRAELQRTLNALGVRRVRFVDEPVAAALGYGLSLTRQRRVMVVDIGGGTMHTVLVDLSPRGAAVGQARVIAKQVRPLGGNAVDGWVLQEFCREAGYELDERTEESLYWRRLMLAEACRVKEAVFLTESTAFRLVPPGCVRLGAAAAPGASLLTFTRERLVELLESNGFYRGLDQCLDATLAAAQGGDGEVEDVLLVGGSTLLPGVFPLLERRFGRRRLRAWQPFEAVAHGAACYAAERISTLDFIVHDYAFVTHEPASGTPRYTVIVPHGTRFPTPPDLWKRQLVPTCALGEPETIFKLVICEIARGGALDERFVWDAAGDLHRVGGSDGGDLVVPLNGASPTLGYLEPPHVPGDRRPRLEIAFGVNGERWLIATVHDLLARRTLMEREPVVRLM